LKLPPRPRIAYNRKQDPKGDGVFLKLLLGGLLFIGLLAAGRESTLTAAGQ
jgi:hypothetical protein